MIKKDLASEKTNSNKRISTQKQTVTEGKSEVAAVNLRLKKWADKLLDIGKRNNLINFRFSKASTAEIVFPDVCAFFSKIGDAQTVEIYNVKEDDTETVETSALTGTKHIKTAEKTRAEYIEKYASQLKPNQILLYNKATPSKKVVGTLSRTALNVLEETGVNVAYVAFGFINWYEKDDKTTVYKAPLLLIPVTLEYTSPLKPCYLKLLDDELIVNPTFNYKLNGEYKVSLPDYKGEDLKKYFSDTKKIVSALGWDITDECVIGLFRFSTISMYNDITQNSEALLKCSAVKMLLGEEYDRGTLVRDNDEFDLNKSLVTLHNVVDADSSQIRAIEKAKAGTSFVLQGPPGTGKSQTITNIIAECLHDGKKVLFVAAKKAALDVVYEKLCQAGLSEACLYLHSQKQNKKEIIDELARTYLTQQKNININKVEQEINTKAQLLGQINDYSVLLHLEIPNINKSAYELIEEFYRYAYAMDIDFIIPSISDKTEANLQVEVELLQAFSEYAKIIGIDYTKHPWYGFKSETVSIETESSIKQTMKKFIDFSMSLSEAHRKLEHYNITARSIQSVKKIGKLLAFLGTNTIVTPKLLAMPNLENITNTITDQEDTISKIIGMRNDIDEQCLDTVYCLDVDALITTLRADYSTFLRRFFDRQKYKDIIEKVRLQYKIVPEKLSYHDALSLLGKIKEYNSYMKKFNANDMLIRDCVGEVYVGLNTDMDDLTGQLKMFAELKKEDIPYGNISTLSFVDFTAKRNEFNNLAAEIEQITEITEEEYSLLEECFDNSVIDIRNSAPDTVRNKLSNCVGNFNSLQQWISFNKLLKVAIEIGLDKYISYAIGKNIPADKIVEAYQKRFYQMYADYAITSNVVLNSFDRVSHDRAVSRFSEIDKKHFKINKLLVRSAQNGKIPPLDYVGNNSPVATLLKEAKKKRRVMSLRKLFNSIGSFVTVLKPCFLMSPISVSTFLDATTVFDVAIFDEASQVFPEYALGSIYRAKQVIIVGDSKQMPPSNFFTSQLIIDETENDDEDEAYNAENYESIMDIACTCLPSISLLWHYRSRYEQLIAFSNKNFYDNQLITFPSPECNEQGTGIDFYFVTGGIFEHKARTNLREAQYVAELVLKNIREYPKRSLGVIAFSVAQQNAIENIINNERLKDDRYEEFFNSKNAEPFFIKNLENCQGDERDTIIFSIAYAKDASGRLMHNFGPLNKEGGERRLNVAVTRARLNIQVVSSIHATDINLAQIHSKGAVLLREYLDYAENGEIALQRGIACQEEDQFDSPFEMDVCEFIRQNGYSVDSQVGCSGYKIDLCVKRENSSEYVLAIECDGASYHSSQNARDRDRLRQEILENMGWRFYRIWSTDWFKNNCVEKSKLLEAVKEALSSVSFEEKVLDEGNNIDEQFIVNQTIQFSFPEYELYDITQAKCYDLTQILFEVIKHESPISMEWLLKRYVQLFHREAVTSYVRDYFMAIFNGSLRRKGIIERNGFLSYICAPKVKFRLPGESRRPLKYVSKEELAQGMSDLLILNGTMTKEDLYKKIAELQGVHRITTNILSFLDEALKLVDDFTVDNDGIIHHIKKNGN